jgi:hypothetical protein
LRPQDGRRRRLDQPRQMSPREHAPNPGCRWKRAHDITDRT